MNAGRLLAHYEKIADAPDAIPRLRRFILDLAVRGKLVEQDPNDEPASELLKRIAEKKKRLLKAGAIRRQKVPVLINRDDLPFPLPRAWVWTQIAELGVLSPRNDSRDSHIASFVPMPMIPADYGATNVHEPRPWGEIKRGYTHFAEGDVGLAKITPCFENGKSIVFRNLTGGIGSGTTELHVVRPLFVNADYTVLFLKSPHFIETGIPRMTGTAGQKRVPAEYFANSPFPLPPLAEQHRIVAKVDELMVLCNRLEEERTARETTRDRLTAASLARLNEPDPDPAVFRNHAAFALDNLTPLTTRPNQIKALRQTILNLAVRGKLVEQDPNDEPASELLKRIAAEKARLVKAGKIRKPKSVESVSPNELVFELPSGWAAAKFSDVLIELQTGPFGSSLHQSDYEIGGTPVINPASMQDGKIVPVEKMAVGDKILERLATFKLRAGDIVMGRRGEMGRCAVVTEQEDGWLCGTGSLILHLSDSLYPKYLATLIGSPYVREYLGGFAVGSTMQNLNQSILLKMSIGLPPLAEQHCIVAKVDELMVLCDQLEASLSTGDHTRHHLLNSMLHEALTPSEEESGSIIPEITHKEPDELPGSPKVLTHPT